MRSVEGIVVIEIGLHTGNVSVGGSMASMVGKWVAQAREASSVSGVATIPGISLGISLGLSESVRDEEEAEQENCLKELLIIWDNTLLNGAPK